MSAEALVSTIAIVVFLVELIGISAAVHAVMNARTSQGAIAWGISLVTFPWLALPLYAVFGRNRFKGYVLIRQARDETIHHVIEPLQQDARDKQLLVEKPATSDTALPQLAELPITCGNQSRLLIDGEHTFQAIFEGIESAKEYILIEFYIIKNDGLGRELKDRLIRKARDKVRVYFLYDEIGSYKLPASYLQQLREAGVTTSAFHTTRGKTNHFQLNFRNHRKIVVIDGHTAYIGGHNVGDEYVSRDPKFGHWRDTHVQVSGPVVKAIQFCFLQDWYWATTGIIDVNWDLHQPEGGLEETLMIASGPADPLETCALMFTDVINSAKRRIWIASPYFIPDIQIIGALKLAALRGVDVRILIPEKPDHRIVHLATFSYYHNTLPFGVKLYRYSAGFMHQKVFLVDANCAAVGTANLDNRSFRLNFELTLLNYDPSFIEKVAVMLEKDFADSRKVDIEDYTKRNVLFKLATRFARLLSPIL